MNRPLNRKQTLFVHEYLVDLCASAAMRRAGYVSKNPDVDGAKLLVSPGIQAAIQTEMNARSKRLGITKDRVLAELAKIGFFDCRKLFESDGSIKRVQDWDEDTAASVASFEVAEIFTGTGEQKHAIGLAKKIMLRDKVRALELLGKHLGMFPNRVEAAVTWTMEDMAPGTKIPESKPSLGLCG